MKYHHLLLLCLLAFLGLSCESNGDLSDNPNILFILTDDQRFDALGHAGNTIIQTPEMDKLAQEGCYFKKAFSTTPICAASRASILTGLYERSHDYTFQKPPLAKELMDESYPVQLKNLGYYTGFYGKLGVEYADAEKLFDQAEMYDRDNSQRGAKGYVYKTIGTEAVHLTRYTGHMATEFIRNAPANKPFCLSLSFSAPHAHDPDDKQYFWQASSNSLYADIDIPAPVYSDSTDFNALPDAVKEGLNRQRWFWRFDTPEKYQHSVKGYYRMISEIDQELGLIRKALQAKGLADNTIIIFASDNGYFLGERQLAGKWLMYDRSVRIPLIIFDPRSDGNQEVEDMVLNTDIFHTILDLAGIQLDNATQSMSLLPYIQHGSHPDKREQILLEHLWNFDLIPASEGVRTDSFKYMRYRDGISGVELYDLAKDPDEQENVADHPEYVEVLNTMRTVCNELIQSYENPEPAESLNP